MQTEQVQTQTSQGHQNVRKYDTGECWRAGETESVEVWEVRGIETTRNQTIQKYNLMKSKKRLDQLIKLFLLQLNFGI